MVALAQATQAGKIAGRISLVLSDVPDAPALARAAAMGIPAIHLQAGPGAHRLRGPFEQAYLDTLAAHEITVVCLAGFMRILEPSFLNEFPNRVLNVHPSLLPSFPGLDAIGQALRYGVRVTGATVHMVDASVDGGPVILQKAVALDPGDDRAAVESRVHTAEHEIFPEAVALLCAGKLERDGRVVRILP